MIAPRAALVRPLLSLGYHPGIAWWVVLYLDRFGTVDGCPWLSPSDAALLRRAAGQRTATAFRPDPVVLAAWKHAHHIEEPAAAN